MKIMKPLLLSTMLAMSLVSANAMADDVRDPWEGFNRVIHAGNQRLDSWVVKPVAQTYDAVLPSFVKQGVSNFFGNIGDVFISANSLLQGKPGDAASDFGRVLVNTTVGIAGLLDVATPMGLEKHDEDFGQTLGVWGVSTGPFLVVPVYGPRDVRDAFGKFVEIKTDPVTRLDDVAVRNSLIVTRLVADRVDLLPADAVIEEAALDKYSYVRDAYLQRRNSLVYDGNPPRDSSEDE